MGSVLNEEIERGIAALAGRYHDRRGALLPAFHLCQQRLGCIPSEAVERIASLLSVPPIKAYETATFYTMFRLEKPPPHQIEICTNLSCSLLGAGRLFDYLKEKLAAGESGVSADGNVLLSEVECLGSCGSAPAMIVDGEYHESLDEKKVAAILDTLK